jgi:hypothetical protein
MIERTEPGRPPMVPPTNQERYDRWKPLYDCFEVADYQPKQRYDLKPQQEQQ